MSLDFTVVIPARLRSTRLPGKPLLLIAGKPMIQHVWEQARKSGASRVVLPPTMPASSRYARPLAAKC